MIDAERRCNCTHPNEMMASKRCAARHARILTIPIWSTRLRKLTLRYAMIDTNLPGASAIAAVQSHSAHVSRSIESLDITTCLYFSAETNTSLGYGDVTPAGPVRFFAGFETLNGLLLIGWSASYLHIAMERYWDTNNAGMNSYIAKQKRTTRLSERLYRPGA